MRQSEKMLQPRVLHPPLQNILVRIAGRQLLPPPATLHGMIVLKPKSFSLSSSTLISS